MNLEAMKESLYSGLWGTIGPKFEEVSEMLAKKCGGEHGVLMHSATAAYEVVLRSMNLCHGDAVLCSVYSDRMDAEVAAGVGIVPVFSDIEKETLAISLELVETILNSRKDIKVIVADYMETLDLNALKKLCEKYSCKLVLNAGDALDCTFDFAGIYAVIFELGICGAAVTGETEIYNDVFAWHHCGHAPGTAASISFDTIVGGDMRISEWQALQVMEIMKDTHPVSDLKERGYVPAWENAALKSDYFRKMTGFAGDYTAEDYPNASAVFAQK